SAATSPTITINTATTSHRLERERIPRIAHAPFQQKAPKGYAFGAWNTAERRPGARHRASARNDRQPGTAHAVPAALCWPSPIRTVTVGPGVAPDPPAPQAERGSRARRGLRRHLTAGREFHPAPKATSQLPVSR